MTTATEIDDPYRVQNGIATPPVPVAHRDDEYDSSAFAVLFAMQRDHFWYRGRHRFLLEALRRHLRGRDASALRMIDCGGGCGGWVAYLAQHGKINAAELALADSSRTALEMAGSVLPATARRYQIDLLNLQWRQRWDVMFLLDVLEHIPDHEAALQQARDALRPGGLLFVTVPALRFFWSWNDEVVHHQRRYSRADFRALAPKTGFRLRDARYFMFFLSPLLLASRAAAGAKVPNMTEAKRRELMENMHRVPGPLVNNTLAAFFAAETPLGHWLPFPWGTSLLAVLEKC